MEDLNIQIMMIFLAIISVVLIFESFLNPSENFISEQLFEKVLSDPVWTEERSISDNEEMKTPPMNWRAVNSTSAFYEWIEVG